MREDTKCGDKVVVTHISLQRTNYLEDIKHILANRIVINKIYTVKGCSHVLNSPPAIVELEEIPGVEFNAFQFENIDSEWVKTLQLESNPGNMMDNSAFPRQEGKTFADISKWHSEGGMTLRTYAAIKLKIPMSGIKELDKMIEISRREDAETQIMAAIATDGDATPRHRQEVTLSMVNELNLTKAK